MRGGYDFVPSVSAGAGAAGRGFADLAAEGRMWPAVQPEAPAKRWGASTRLTRRGVRHEDELRSDRGGAAPARPSCGSPATGRAGLSSPPADAAPAATPSSVTTPSSVASSGGGVCRSKDMAVRLDGSVPATGAADDLRDAGVRPDRAHRCRCPVHRHRPHWTVVPLHRRRRPRHRGPAPAGSDRRRRDRDRGSAVATTAWSWSDGTETRCPTATSVAITASGDSVAVTAPWVAGHAGLVCPGAVRLSPVTG